MRVDLFLRKSFGILDASTLANLDIQLYPTSILDFGVV